MKTVVASGYFNPLHKGHVRYLQAAKELGDIAWYWINGCRALNLDPNQIMADNVKKLESRYPGGKFSIEASANRAEGDI